MLKCIAIDDEPLALRQLRHYASKCEGVEVVSTYRNAVDAASNLLSEGCEGCDLIFCDVNMPELSGVEFVSNLQDQMLTRGLTPPMVIFTTAHSEYAVEGFRLDAVDYLLKPYSLTDFTRSVSRAISLFELREEAKKRSSGDSSGEVLEGIHTEPQMEYISVKADYKTTRIRLCDIVYIESEGEYIKIHIENSRPITTLCRLKNIEAQLPANAFARIHRSYIINLGRVYSYDRTRIYIAKEEYLPIGLNYRSHLHERLTQMDDTLTME